ncbi:MAG: DUF2093 domain-containing protein [Rhizobiales bacterium]|nr:DUF2093 domain-containing protein [Hyphomicrobiales bacterium]
MNRLERGFQPAREAKLKFVQGDFRVVVPGSFVRCAVSGEEIALDDLKYWNVERQEAYASAEIALKRHLELGGKS